MGKIQSNKKSKSFIDGKIVDTSTGECIYINGEENKYYVAVVKLGHCGNGYFIPALKCSGAVDMDAAIECIKTKGKVKNHKYSIINICEISLIERILIERINYLDEFIMARTASESAVREIEKRRIPLPEFVEYNLKGRKNIKLSKFKGCEDFVRNFPEDCVVERFCAPYYNGDKIIYPSKINMRQLLDEFFYQKVRLYDNELMIIFYYEIYGENNRLGIRYTPGKLTYINKNGEEIVVVLDEEKEKFIIMSEEFRKPTKKCAKPIEPEDTVIERRPSKIDRFKQRLERTAEIKKSKDDGKSL